MVTEVNKMDLGQHWLLLLPRHHLMALAAQGGGGGTGLPRHGLGVPAGSVASSGCSPSTYLAYVVFVYYTLLWVAMRVAANEVLVQGKVRDKTREDQFVRMNKKQREEECKSLVNSWLLFRRTAIA